MKSNFKRFIEKFVEGILFMSGTITTITVLLIVVFLFKEGSGLFKNSGMEKGFVLAVNKSNPVRDLSSYEIKEIFDHKITNWKDVNGKNQEILVFHVEDILNYYTEDQVGAEFENLPRLLNNVVDSLPNIIAYVPEMYLEKGFKGAILPQHKLTLLEFFFGKEWYPTSQPSAQFGALPLITGTLWVSLWAILISLPLGLSVAIYMAEIANPKVRNWLKPVIELLAGIPSVVYGFFGLIVVVPVIQQIFNLPVGETALAGSIILAIMALPTIITISEDAIRTTPRAMKEASLALGATHWQTIYKVVLPYSSSGIAAAAILGIGRAIGETMAVLMVTGNAAILPPSLLEPVRTIPATIAAEMGEAPQGGIHFEALFALGAILFIMTLIINIVVDFISSKKKLSKR